MPMTVSLPSGKHHLTLVSCNTCRTASRKERGIKNRGFARQSQKAVKKLRNLRSQRPAPLKRWQVITPLTSSEPMRSAIGGQHFSRRLESRASFFHAAGAGLGAIPHAHRGIVFVQERARIPEAGELRGAPGHNAAKQASARLSQHQALAEAGANMADQTDQAGSEISRNSTATRAN